MLARPGRIGGSGHSGREAALVPCAAMANMTLDRLISGAGAVAAGADDLAHGFGGESESRLLGRRPPAVLVAIVLLGLAGLLVLVGVEATDPPTAQELQAGALAHDDRFGQRTYATISGSLAAIYTATYTDADGDEVQDEDEADRAWYYWLVDPNNRAGVTIRSERPPSEVFTSRIRGVVTVDPAYVEEDVRQFGDEVRSLDLTLDARTYIDARNVPDGTAEVLDLGAPIPVDGTLVEVAGSRLVDYLAVCPDESDGDCVDAVADGFDIVVYDPAAKRAITVLTSASPEFTPMTLTGTLRRDERSVDNAQRGGALDDEASPLEVSSHYILDDGAGPSSSPLAFMLAAALAILGGTILVGSAGGYLLYRRAPGPLPAPASTLVPGARLPLRVTGFIQTPAGRLHVREAPADLLRFVLRPAMSAPAIVSAGPDDVAAPPGTSGPEDPAGEAEAVAPVEAVAGPPADPAPPAQAIVGTPAVTTLVIERTGHPHGVSVGAGQLARLSSGTVTPARGPRPALRAMAGTGRLLLSFDTAADRDRAAAELLAETGLGPDGRMPTSA